MPGAFQELGGAGTDIKVQRPILQCKYYLYMQCCLYKK